MPASTTSSSAPASQTRMSTENGSCFGALFKACRKSKSGSLDADGIDVFEKNPHFKKITEEEFQKLYKVKKTIGVGGFSVVKKGKHIPTGQDVAIKVIDRSKFDPNDGSLEAEIVVLDRVHHEYCIGFRECFFTKKHVYVITELVTGGELLDRVLKEGKYAERKAARTMKQLLEGVAYLHSIGVTHRDLKLENILLTSPDDDSPIKIADFGLSKIFAGTGPLTTICGSPQYVAPEVLEVGQKRLCYTPAADLWSTGVIMYILLSGYSPFDDPNEAILFQKIKKGMYSMKEPVWESVTYEGKDLMRRLLITAPEKRLTAKQALQHPWFQVMLNQLEENLPVKKGVGRGSKSWFTNEVVDTKTDTSIEARNEITENPEKNLVAQQETEVAKQETEVAKQETGGENQDQPKTCNSESKEGLESPKQGTEGGNLEQLKICNDGSEEHALRQDEVSEQPKENVSAQREISKNLKTEIQERVKTKVILKDRKLSSKSEWILRTPRTPRANVKAKKKNQEEVYNITTIESQLKTRDQASEVALEPGCRSA